MIDPKTVILYASLKPSSRAGCVNLILANGRVFSCDEHGNPGDRDPGTDGPFEQAQVTGTIAAFNSFGHFHSFGAAPIDKLI